MLKIYTLENCPNCKELKTRLNSKNIDFSEVNVDEDFVARAKMIEKDMEDLPVVELNGILKDGSVDELSDYIMKNGLGV